MFELQVTDVETIKPCARCWLHPTVHVNQYRVLIVCGTCSTESVVAHDRADAIGEWNGLMSALNEAVIVAGVIDG